MEEGVSLKTRLTGDDRSGTPRYLQLAALLRRRIEQGEWTVGRQIPTLEQLAAETGAALATVRKAVAALVRDGLLITRRPKGTFVLRNPAQVTWREVDTDARGVLRGKGGARVKVLSVGPAPDLPFTPHQGLLAPAYLRLERVYWRMGKPFMLDNLYLDATCGDVIAGERATLFAHEIALAVRPPLVRHDQTLTLTGADPVVARRLKIPLNTPVARIDRSRADAAGRLRMISIGLYRGDVVRLHFSETASESEQ